MRADHKVIMEKAKKDGMLPMQLAAELLVHDLVEATRKQMSRYEVGYNKMTEKQQDAVLADLQDAYKGIAEIAARVIAGAGTPTIVMTLKDMKIAKSCTVTGTVEGHEKYFNELIAKAQDKSEVLIVLYERQYDDALDNIQSDKDQKSLNLGDGGKAGKKPAAAKPAEKKIELTPGLIEHAKEFVIKFQNATVAGLQNQLKIDIDKAKTLHVELEKLGILTEPDDNGERKLIRPDADAPAAAEPQNSGDPMATIDDETYVKVKAKVIADKRISVGFLQAEFALGEEQALAAIARLEADGVVGEENELGGRAVLVEA